MLKAKSLVKLIVPFLLVLVLGGANLSCPVAVVKIGPEGEINVDVSLEPDGQLPTINLFHADPSSIPLGDTSTIEWSVSGATEISINQGIGSAIPTGSIEVAPTATATYIITATNAAGSVTRSVTIAVTTPSAPTSPPATSLPPTSPPSTSPPATSLPPTSPPPTSPPATSPVINSFTASPASISSGGSSNLGWSVSGATSISISPGGGSLPASGSAMVSPAATTTYTLTAANAAGPVTRQVTVTVASAPPASLPVINFFTASPASISSGGNSTLGWSVSGATSISISPGGGSLPASGSATVSPAATTTYTLTAANAAGPVTRPVTVTVSGAPPPSGDVATCEQALFDAVNALRTANGKAALTRNAFIDGLCRDHAQYMAAAGTLSHDNFDTRYTAIAATIPTMHAFAENVLQNNMPCDATAMAQQWFLSPGHHDNMLDVHHTHTISGMGIEIDGSGRIWACQMFAGP